MIVWRWRNDERQTLTTRSRFCRQLQRAVRNGYALWLAVSGLLAIEAAPAGQAPPPNIIILLADDLGYGDLGCYGNAEARTPNLDRLAREGLQFTECYASFPVCSPSRAGLLTGRNASRYSIEDWIPAHSGIYLPRTEVTFASVLRESGYRTAHFGKWHLNSRTDGTEPTPMDHGFQYAWYTQNNAAPSHLNPTNFIRGTEAVGPLTGAAALLVVEEAIRWLDATADDHPFLLNIWFHEPHEPVASAAEFLRAHSEVSDPARREYLANVSQMDFAVGKIMDAIDARGLKDRTFIFFTSDNGPETLNRYAGAQRSHGSPGNLRGMKLHLTEGGIRVPGLVRWPGHFSAGSRSAEPVIHLDLLPTLCALSGLRPPTERVLDGVNFLPALKGVPLRRPEPFYWQYERGGPWTSAIREGGWKLLANEGAYALYDLIDDPSETRDRSVDRPGVATALAAKLRERILEWEQPPVAVSDPDGIGTFYLGREIARVMGHEGAPWLERVEREQEERPDRVLELLKLSPGAVVADVGAGSGYYTRRLARAVGPTGKVLAVDVQPEMLDILDEKLRAEGITNVVPVLGSVTDPGLPDAALDLVIMVDVYHEFSYPFEMMRAICQSLRPGGRVVLVEYRAEDPDVPIKPLHKMSEVQVRREMALHPLRWERTISDQLPWQHFIEFSKTEF